MQNNVAPANNAAFICPNCGHENNASDKFCSNCGADLELLRQAERAMETDPELIQLNERYVKYGKNSTVAGWTAIICLAVFCAWLEYDILEFMSTPAMLTAPIAFVVWLINKVLRKNAWKKIDAKLTELTGFKQSIH